MDTSIFLTDESSLLRPRRASGPIRPYVARIPDVALAELHARLDALAGELEPVRELAEAWRGFDWRAWEARLADWPGFKTEIDGGDLHFLHVRSPEANALPLVLLPGRPAALAELLELIEPLTDPVSHGGGRADAFHVVLLSLPGTGFSSQLAPAWDPRRQADAVAALMARLGYRAYAVHGADASVDAACQLAEVHAERVLGVHFAPPRCSPAPSTTVTPEELVSWHAESFADLDGAIRETFLAELGLAWFSGNARSAGELGEPGSGEPPAQWVAELRELFRRS